MHARRTTAGVATLVLSLLMTLPIQVCTQAADPAVASARASAALDAMMALYDWPTGLWQPEADWWLSGNALQALLDYMARTGSRTYMAEVENTIRLQRAPVPWWPQGEGEFRADSTDDTAWWALAMTRMHDLTKNQTYLDIAELGMIYMHDYWDDVCGGGIYWSIKRLSYKNAISIELYIKPAAALHNRIPGDELYLGYALKALQWFNASGMINDENLINDGLNNSCLNNGLTTWTYNQGVILGGLAELYLATGDDGLLDFARLIVDAVVTSPLLSPGGILAEPCEAWGRSCNSDQTSFKGIFARNLGELDDLFDERPYRNYLLNQADSAYENGRNDTDQYGLSWSGPFVASTFSISTQYAAVSLLTAVLVDGESISPSSVPTYPDTSEPTAMPMRSDLPTSDPSLSPTPDPSRPPTLDPSVGIVESVSPTAVPSDPDTSEPSVTPSSDSPTLAPSLSPTLAPSSSLTIGGVAPSVSPTSDPSVSPTSDPSVSPFDPSKLTTAGSGSGRAASHKATLAVALSVGMVLFVLSLGTRGESRQTYAEYDHVMS